MQRRVTLKDVAQKAKVSVMTVSNVINGKFYHVTAQTRDRVQEAIEDLGYKASLPGRSLRLSRRFAIGLIIIDPNPTFIADPYTTFLVAGLSNTLSRKGYGLLLQGTTLESLPEVLMLRHSLVDGICLFSSGTPEQLRLVHSQLSRHHEPLVIIQDGARTEMKDVLSIRQDDTGGAKLLAERLLKQGCRKLVFLVGAHRWPALDAREKGLRTVVRRAQGASLTVVRAASEDVAAIETALARHVAERGLPDGIFAGNDQLAIVAQSWLGNQGCKVPDTVKVTGFNAFDFSRFARPRLTTIRSPAYALGELAATAQLERLESGAFRQKTIELPVELEEGESA
jgi:LacI family transcriptional regulator